jgi:hypothetical protein
MKHTKKQSLKVTNENRYDEQYDVAQWVKKHGSRIYAENGKTLPTMPKWLYTK